MRKDTIIFLLIASCFIGLIAGGISHWASMPTVYFSNETQKCTKVENYRDDVFYNCDDLPNKYNWEWVK